MNNLPMTNEALRSMILKAKHAYYYSGEPIMSDAEYDALEDQLRQIAPDDPVLALVGSPVPVDTILTKARHSIPMGSRSGDLFTFVRPEVVAEVNVTDLQAESSDGHVVKSMALDFDEKSGWKAVGAMPTANWLHPVLIRIRDDKKAVAIGTRFSQILDRCHVEDVSARVRERQLPESKIIRRTVWTKTTKGKVAVRKLVASQTNKSDVDPTFPAYVLHWTDYSSGRATPLDREVRTDPQKS